MLHWLRQKSKDMVSKLTWDALGHPSMVCIGIYIVSPEWKGKTLKPENLLLLSMALCTVWCGASLPSPLLRLMKRISSMDVLYIYIIMIVQSWHKCSGTPLSWTILGPTILSFILRVNSSFCLRCKYTCNTTVEWAYVHVNSGLSSFAAVLFMASQYVRGRYACLPSLEVQLRVS